MKKIINTILLAGLLTNATAFANAPAGFQLNSAVGAEITISSTSDAVIRQTEPKQILDWQTFNLNSGELVKFNQVGNRDWSTLNRINSTSTNSIFGEIKQDSSLYLMNANGISFPDGSPVVGCTAGLSVSASNGLTIGCQGDLSVLGGIIQDNKKISLISAGAINITGQASLIAPQIDIHVRSKDEITLFSDSLPDVPLIRDSDTFKKKVYIDKRMRSGGQASLLFQDINNLTKGSMVTLGSKSILRDEAEHHWMLSPFVAGDISLTGLSHNIQLTTADNLGFIKPITTFTAVSAVPEPSTYLMMLLGLVGIIGVARRKD